MLCFIVAPAQPGDAGEILALQDRNHVSNVAAAKLADGFVTTQLSHDSLAEMVAERMIWTARTADGRLAGYACAVTWGHYGEGPFQSAAKALFPLSLDGREVTVPNSFQYGPVCVAEEFRGQGVLASLISGIKAHSASDFGFGITFIDSRNLRSLAAHERKMGFGRLAVLPFGSVVYHMLGFSTRENPSL